MGQTLTSLNLIWVLMWLKFVPRNRRESAKLFWIFVEPAGQLAVMITIFTYIGRMPAYGTSMALFLLTGIAMLSFFGTGSGLVMQGMLQTNSKMRLSPVGLFHDAIAQMLFKLISALGYTTLLLIGVGYVQGINVVPAHPLVFLEAMIWCALLAFGVGLNRAYCSKYIPFIERIYSTLSRALIFISGVFYVPSFMAPQVRDLLVYNPVLHVIEHLRLGMYDQYPTIVYSSLYLKLFVGISIALGMTLIWRKRAEFTD